MPHSYHPRQRTTRIITLALIVAGLTCSITAPGYLSSRLMLPPAHAAAAKPSSPADHPGPEKVVTNGSHASLPTTAAADQPARKRVSETYGKLPLSFERNEGQTDGRVKYMSRGAGYSLFLTGREAVLSLSRAEKQTGGNASPAADKARAKPPTVVRMQVVGGNQTPVVSGEDELAGKTNYFIGNDAAKWRSNVATYGRVRYREAYDGIDLVYYGNGRQLEYDFVVAPGANPGAIRLRFDGARRMKIDSRGDLVLSVGGGEIRQRKPVVYQEVNGVRREVAGRYVILSKREVGFKVADYDESRPLVIDPVLVYSTYLGGNSEDLGRGIAVDTTGSGYVTGRTNSINFPTANPFQPCCGGGSHDAFVTKMNAEGTALVYSTYLGGNSFDGGYGIAVDASGNAYVTGDTGSTNFPTVNPFQLTVGGVSAFVTKINAAGSALIYSTYLGGSSDDYGYDIATDTSGNAYVTGRTDSINFPVVNPFQSTNGGASDAFVTKFNAAGTPLYSTYLGGNGFDEGDSIAADMSGNAYVTGNTGSTNFPTVSPLQPSIGGVGSADAFVTKMNVAGTPLYSTYLGGNSEDYGRGIAVDPLGNAYVIGITLSSNFPTMNPFQAAIGGAYDAFVTKMNTAGTGLLYSTYLGGSEFDDARGIAVNASNVYVAGRTDSTDFPILNPSQIAYGGAGDAFVTKFNASGATLNYSTYLGASNEDHAAGIAVDRAGNAYVTGRTGSINFPTLNPFQPTSGSGSYDAFLTKIAASADAVTLTSGTVRRVSDGVEVSVRGSGLSLNYFGDLNNPAFPQTFILDTIMRGSGTATFNGMTTRSFSGGGSFGGTRLTGRVIGYANDDFFRERPPIFSVEFDAAGFTTIVQPPGEPTVRTFTVTASTEPVRVALSRDGSGQLRATVSVTNPTANPIPGVSMRLVRASTVDGSAFVDGIPAPQAFGTVNSGQTVTATVTFPGTAAVPAGFSGLVRVDLSYMGGTYTETEQVVTP